MEQDIFADVLSHQSTIFFVKVSLIPPVHESQFMKIERIMITVSP